MICLELFQRGWSDTEIEEAATTIAFNPEIAKEAVYSGAVVPHLFTLARLKKEVKRSLVCSVHPERPAEGSHMNTQYCGECLDKNVWRAA